MTDYRVPSMTFAPSLRAPKGRSNLIAPWRLLRRLRRALQRHVESPLSVTLLKGEFKISETIIVDVNEKGITFSRKVAAPLAETGTAV